MTNFNSVVPVTSVKYNNANGSPLVIIALNDGTITVRFYRKITTRVNNTKRWKLTQTAQKVKSFLLARCHQNSDKVTETVTKKINQVNKIFTKIVKVSSHVFIEKAFYKWKPFFRIFRHVRREFLESIKKEYSLAELANYLPFLLIFSRQVAITQAEKLVGV